MSIPLSPCLSILLKGSQYNDEDRGFTSYSKSDYVSLLGVKIGNTK